MNLLARGVYRIRNSLNGMVYVGSAQIKFAKRRVDHFRMLREGTHFNHWLQQAWNKYGEGAFVFEVIEECEENILDKEQKWIDHYASQGLAYNLCSVAGSRMGVPHAEEVRVVIGTHTKKHWEKQEYRDKIKVSKQGETRSASWKKQQSERMKVIMSDAAARRRLSDMNKGKPLHHSTLIAAVKANAKIWKFISPVGEVVEIENLHQYCKAQGLDYQSLCFVHNGKYKQYRGWTIFIDTQV